jgi:hypothetical protein
MCGDAEETDPDDTQMCRRLADAIDSVNNRNIRRILSKLYWTARKKMEEIPSVAKEQKKKGFLFCIQSQWKAFLLIENV